MIVSSAQHRRTTTPNATMTTLASPTLGAATGAMWLVEMHPGAEGPVHAFAREVLWTITRGSAVLHLEGAETGLTTGDTAVLPAGVARQLIAGPDGFSAVAATADAAAAEVTRGDGASAGVPPWVA